MTSLCIKEANSHCEEPAVETFLCEKCLAIRKKQRERWIAGIKLSDEYRRYRAHGSEDADGRAGDGVH